MREIIRQLFQELTDTITRLEQLDLSMEWQPFDILDVEPDYVLRQQIHRHLVLLHSLDLIDYIPDPTMGLALTVRLLQENVEPDQLDIDLRSLRLKETHQKHELHWIERYAALRDPEQYASEFERYFFAHDPLIQRLEETFREDVTREQREIITADGGIHLIEGPAGCGKTTALVEHIKFLTYRRHVPLDRIMVTTHFHSAAGRIEKQLETPREDGDVMLTTTINSFGSRLFLKHYARLLRPDGEPYYRKDPQLFKGDITTQTQKTPLISRALTMLHDGTWPQEGWPDDLEKPEMPQRHRRRAATEDLCWRAIK